MNAKGTSLSRKLKRRKRLTQNKTIKKMVIGPYILIITLNVNGLNAKPNDRLAEKMKTCAVCASTYYITLLNPLVEEKEHSERRNLSVMSDSL